jgi:hypothetical protein
MDETSYATDGESVFARRIVRPIAPIPGEGAGEIRWMYEEKDDRGWGFYGVHLPDEDGDGVEHVERAGQSKDVRDRGVWKWASRVPDIPQAEEASAEDYWAGFSSPSDSPVEDEGDEQDAEDSYWAQYSAGAPSAGPSARPTPAASRRHSRMKATTATAQAKTTEQTVAQVADVLSALHPALSGQGPANSTGGIQRGRGVSAEDELIALKGRLAMKLSSLLWRAWAEYVAGAEREDELEERAIGWLRLGRQIGPTKAHGDGLGLPGGEVGDERDVIALAKMEVLAEMWGETHADEPFYRFVEGAVSMSRPETRERRYSAEQNTYWE